MILPHRDAHCLRDVSRGYSLDLVVQGVLTHALRAWPGGLVVASHDRAFLSAIGTSTFIKLGS